MAAILALFTDCQIYDAVGALVRLGDMEVKYQCKVRYVKTVQAKEKKKRGALSEWNYPPRDRLKIGQCQIWMDLPAASLATAK